MNMLEISYTFITLLIIVFLWIVAPILVEVRGIKIARKERKKWRKERKKWRKKFKNKK